MSETSYITPARSFTDKKVVEGLDTINFKTLDVPFKDIK